MILIWDTLPSLSIALNKYPRLRALSNIHIDFPQIHYCRAESILEKFVFSMKPDSRNRFPSSTLKVALRLKERSRGGPLVARICHALLLQKKAPFIFGSVLLRNPEFPGCIFEREGRENVACICKMVFAKTSHSNPKQNR